MDPLGREPHISLGCALENLILASAARGFAPVVTLLPQPDEPAHVANVELPAGPVSSSTLHDAIGDRHTNRDP